VNHDETMSLASHYFESFSVWNGTGVWQGTQEHSIVFEVVGEQDTEQRVRDFAFHVKKQNKQQAVLITTEPLLESVLV
jgi:hypothetical protein